MEEATIIYPHQLFANNPAIVFGRTVFLVEEPLFLTEFPVHAQKLLLHRLSMQAYKEKLVEAGHNIIYLSIQELPDTGTVFKKIKGAGIKHLHIIDTTDNWLEKRISKAVVENNFEITRYESPLFILDKADSVQRYKDSKKHLARFYQKLRVDKKILIEADKSPVGGRWSFDEDNRNKLPKNAPLPDDIKGVQGPEINQALNWLKTVPGEIYGDHGVWLPWTHDGAYEYLETFIRERLSHFGTYEDAIATEHVRLFHSTLSPLLNIGLIDPKMVLERALKYSQDEDIQLNNTEGFVRQILGWREFIRASYECDGPVMRTKNFWNHQNDLPSSFWDATTEIEPLDISICSALRFGYNHHIERLMVLGNFMLLCETNPDHVYRWFMAMYVDAYDWVMVPNVYGMSQFSDGGSFATKPYISGSNYIKKMSNHQKGDWEEIWTALYWNFINTHKEFFSTNHRLSMMPRLLENMNEQKRAEHLQIAKDYLSKK